MSGELFSSYHALDFYGWHHEVCYPRRKQKLILNLPLTLLGTGLFLVLFFFMAKILQKNLSGTRQVLWSKAYLSICLLVVHPLPGCFSKFQWNAPDFQPISSLPNVIQKSLYDLKNKCQSSALQLEIYIPYINGKQKSYWMGDSVSNISVKAN